MADIRIIPAAQAELDQAYAYYLADAGERTADEFFDEMLVAFGKISDNPERCAAEDGKYRSFILDRYSYHIVYRIEARQSVRVVAIAHTSRQPGFWKGR